MGKNNKWINKEDLLEALDNIILDIELGSSLKKALDKHGVNSKLFYECRANKHTYKNDDGEEVQLETPDIEKRYALACVLRADALFEEMLDIADQGENDSYIDKKTGKKKTDWDVLGRSRLRVDVRKWMLAKTRPERYGEAQLLKIGDHEGNQFKGSIFPMDILNVPGNDSTAKAKGSKEEDESNSGEPGSW